MRVPLLKSFLLFVCFCLYYWNLERMLLEIVSLMVTSAGLVLNNTSLILYFLTFRVVHNLYIWRKDLTNRDFYQDFLLTVSISVVQVGGKSCYLDPHISLNCTQSAIENVWKSAAVLSIFTKTGICEVT